MALENFEKLKVKKKDNILNAIIDCLKKHEYDELSINDIIQQADISRGSFYNYFIDKNDAVMTLINSKLYDLRDIFINNIKACNNSMFDGVLKTYDDIDDYLENENYCSIIKNIHYLRDIVTKILYSENFKMNIEEVVNWLINNTIEGKTALNEKSKMLNVFGMILSLVLEEISCKVELKNLEIFRYVDFKFKLEVIKNGIKCI